MSSRGSFRTGMGFAGMSFISMAVIGMVSSVVIARIFGVRVVGEFALASAPASAMLFLSTVKEQTALIKRLTALEVRDPRVTGLWAAVFTFSMGLTIVIALIAAGIAYLLYNGPVDNPELFKPAVVCLIGYTFIFNVGWNVDGVFAAFVAGRSLYYVRLHQTLALLFWYVVTGILLDGVWGLVLATYFLSPGTALVHRLIAVRRYMRLRVPLREVREGFRILPEIIRFGLRMTPGTVAQGLSVQSPTWMLGILADVTAVGAFNRAQNLTLRFQDLTSRITEMLFPTLVSRRAEGDHLGFDRAFIDTMRYSTLMLLAIASVGGGGAIAIMQLFGPGFAPAATAFAILILMPAITTVAIIQAHALYAVDRPGAASLSTIGRLIVTVGLGYVLTRSMGLDGAAISLIGGAVFDVMAKGLTVRRYLTNPVRHLWTPRQMLAAVIAYGGGFLAARTVHSALPVLASLPLVGLAGIVAFGACFVLAGGFNDRDRRRLSEIAGRRFPQLRTGQA